MAKAGAKRAFYDKNLPYLKKLQNNKNE